MRALCKRPFCPVSVQDPFVRSLQDFKSKKEHCAQARAIWPAQSPQRVTRVNYRFVPLAQILSRQETPNSVLGGIVKRTQYQCKHGLWTRLWQKSHMRARIWESYESTPMKAHTESTQMWAHIWEHTCKVRAHPWEQTYKNIHTRKNKRKHPFKNKY